MRRALIIGGIGVAFLGAAYILTWVNQADQPEIAALSSILSPGSQPKEEPAPAPPAPAVGAPSTSDAGGGPANTFPNTGGFQASRQFRTHF